MGANRGTTAENLLPSTVGDRANLPKINLGGTAGKREVSSRPIVGGMLCLKYNGAVCCPDDIFSL